MVEKEVYIKLLSCERVCEEWEVTDLLRLKGTA
jgi:hypothetical protein